MKGFLATICCIVNLAVLLNSSAYAGLPEAIAKIKPSIVGIGTYQANRRQQLTLRGTGFVVGDGRHVLTNHHVVSQILDVANQERYVVFVGHGSQGKAVGVQKVGLDPHHDLALLKIDGKPLPALKVNDSRHVREGEQFAFTGFPIGAVLGLYPVTHRGAISAITPYVAPLNRGKQLTAQQIKHIRDNEAFHVYQLDAVAYPGNSGSPLYEIKTGEVVGILNSVFVKQSRENVLKDPSGISYAIPAKYITRLLSGYLK